MVTHRSICYLRKCIHTSVSFRYAILGRKITIFCITIKLSSDSQYSEYVKCVSGAYLQVVFSYDCHSDGMESVHMYPTSRLPLMSTEAWVQGFCRDTTAGDRVEIMKPSISVT